MEHVLLSGALYVIAALAMTGVFAPHLDDTLIQRLGLSLIAIGALSMAAWCHSHEIPGAMAVLIIGVALFMVATAIKLYRAHRESKTRRRRITDRLEFE